MSYVNKFTEIKEVQTCKYDNISLGEVMLRLDPRDVTTARMQDNIRVFQGGGETNVSCGLSYTFGLRTTILTSLVDDPIGRNIENQLRSAGVDTTNIIWWDTEGKDTTYTNKNNVKNYSTDSKGTIANGINFTYNGSGRLPSNTTYYRAHSPSTRLSKKDFDLDKMFSNERTRIFNTGGIFTLIGKKTAELAIEAARIANYNDTFVAADLNYRSKVEPNKKRAKEINKQLTPYLGMLVGNDKDLFDALGFETKINKDADYDQWIDEYTKTLYKVAETYPNLSLIGTQWRKGHDADNISWGGVLYDTIHNKIFKATLREKVPIRDRTGGGDSFLSGVLASLMINGTDLQTAVEWGTSHGILIQETPGDITMIKQQDIINEIKTAVSGSDTLAIR